MFQLVSSTDDQDGADGECDKNACYAVRMRKFLEAYDKPAMTGYQAFDPAAELGPTCGAFPYGFTGSNVKPCIVVKFNKIWDWTPTPIDAVILVVAQFKYLSIGIKSRLPRKNRSSLFAHFQLSAILSFYECCPTG